MELMREVSRGGWLLERVDAQTHVAAVAGAGFEAYVRILHPVPVHRGEEATRWPWSEVAQRVGRTMHPLVQWNRLADIHDGPDFADGWEVGQTTEGFLALDPLAVLTGHLSEVTTAPDDLVVGFWNGWGELSGAGGTCYVKQPSDLRGRLAGLLRQGVPVEPLVLPEPEVRAAVVDGPFLRWRGLEMILFATSVDELADPRWAERAGLGIDPGTDELGPQLVWPQDHVWVVASDIDGDSTIVAGSRALVDAVLADERLESYEVDEDSDLGWEGDLVNPPRAGWSEGP